jgi:uncharacterized membrane protein YbhN (UPF0104 family)/tRNA A-37 threonylcarbamoyl transferase component Bud32
VSVATGEELPEIVGQPPADDVRSGADVVRLALAWAVLVATVIAGWLAGDTVRTVQQDLASLAEVLPDGLRAAMAGGAQLAVLLIPGAALVFLLVHRRTRVVGRVLLAVAVTIPLCIALTTLAADVSPSSFDSASETESWIRDSGFPGTAYLGALAAGATVLGPWVGRRWRRGMWWAVVLVAVLRVLSESSSPFVLVAAGAIGVAVGATVLLVFGAPDRAPSAREVADAIGAAGVPLRRLTFARVTREGVHGYVADTVEGDRRYVALLSDDGRRRDLVFRLYRYLRVKSVADEEVFRSTRSLAEHHAFLALWAHEAGVRAPRPVVVAPVGSHAITVVEELVRGTALDEIDPDRVDDAALRAVWAEAGRLHDARIAHRDLRPSSIRLETGDAPTAAFVGFTWAELSTDPALVGIDLAQLLCELALVTDVERTVAAALDVLGADRLAAALPYLQLPALTPDTRKRVRRHKGLVKELRTAVTDAAGVEAVKLEKLQRITVAQVLMVAFIGVAIYLLLPMVASLPAVWDSLQEAEWGWVVATLPLAAGMYVGSALNFMGAVPGRLPFGITYEVQLASAFLNRVTPKNVGGMALRLRFLTMRGIDPATSAASVGLTSVAGTVSTTVLMVVFFLWAGRDDQLSFSTPSLSSILFWIVVIGIVLGLFMLTKVGRRLILDTAWGYVKTALTNLGPLLKDPTKLAMLLGGSALNTLLQITALSWTLRAFGTPLPYSQVGVVYLFANLVASASPTPGGIGVIEAALIYLLTGFGVPDAQATSAVLVFRAITYWLVTLPGWISLRRLRTREIV